MVVTNDKNDVQSDRKRKVGSFSSVLLELANEIKDGDKANSVTSLPNDTISSTEIGS